MRKSTSIHSPLRHSQLPIVTHRIRREFDRLTQIKSLQLKLKIISYTVYIVGHLSTTATFFVWAYSPYISSLV